MIVGDTKRNSQGMPRLVNAAFLEDAFGGNDESWLNVDKPWIMASKVGTQYVLANVSPQFFSFIIFCRQPQTTSVSAVNIPVSIWTC